MKIMDLATETVSYVEVVELRDYFAAAALTGIVSAREEHGFPPPSRTLAGVDAYEYADAMLEARKQ